MSKATSDANYSSTAPFVNYFVANLTGCIAYYNIADHSITIHVPNLSLAGIGKDTSWLTLKVLFEPTCYLDSLVGVAHVDVGGAHNRTNSYQLNEDSVS